MSAPKLAIESIFPNPNQPRKEFDPEKLRELAASIKQYGVMEPIVVTPRGDRFMIIGGERRYRASLLAGLTEMPVHIIEADDALVEEMALLENIQRQDLNDIEEARAFQSLLDRGMSKEELAVKLGKQVRYIDMRAGLLNLSPDYQAMTVKGKLNHNEAYEMSRLTPEKQAVVLKQILAGNLKTFNKLRAFVDGLIEIEKQESLFTLESISEEEKKSIDEFDSLLRSAERFIATANKDRLVHLRKAVFHSSVTPERLDLIIQQFMKLRKIVHAGSGVKEAARAVA
jgi:ParB family transcriptional regulator, chromosome partitioning protein